MNFVCGTDFGENATRASEIAARLAAKANQQLTLVHAIELPTIGYFAGDPFVLPVLDTARATEDVKCAADKKLAAESERLTKMAGGKVIPRLTIATPSSGILEAAAETSPAIIVSGTYGRSAPGRFIFGSTTDRLVRRASNPVLVVREPADGLEKWSKGESTLRVLLGVSFDESFDEAARAAKTLAAWGPCELHYAHSTIEMSTIYSGFEVRSPMTPSDERAPNARMVMNLAKGRGLPVESDKVHLLRGPSAHALVEIARRGLFDLIVVGTHGRRGLDRALLGSVALAVLHHSPCPVLVAPVI